MIKEIDGNRSFKFIFMNKGKTPILIKNVEASCGCTTGKWTKYPVLPGKKGFVDVLFDPSNRPGNFSKTLLVHTNLKPSIFHLKIMGKVEPKVKTILDEYSYELSSGIRFKYNQFAFMSVKENTSKRLLVKFLNNSSKDITLMFKNLPAYLKIVNISKKVGARKEGIIELDLSSHTFKKFGLIEKDLSLFVNGIEEKILLTANICEDFSKLSDAEMAAAPRISINNKVNKFMEISKGDYIYKTYTITNMGESKLVIHRIYSKYSMNYELPLYELNPGDSTHLNLCLATGTLSGKQNILVKLISNDPRKHEIKLRFIGEIKD
jgi:hypothetical protein